MNGNHVFTAAAVGNRTRVPNKPNQRPVSSSVTGRCATARQRAERQKPETLETKRKAAVHSLFLFVIRACVFPVKISNTLLWNESIWKKGCATAAVHSRVGQQTWPWACGAPACAAGPQQRWRAGPAAASPAQSAACAGRHRSGGEGTNKSNSYRLLISSPHQPWLFWLICLSVLQGCIFQPDIFIAIVTLGTKI